MNGEDRELLIVAWALATVVVLGVLGMVTLAAMNKAIPKEFAGLSGAAVGALAMRFGQAVARNGTKANGR